MMNARTIVFVLLAAVLLWAVAQRLSDTEVPARPFPNDLDWISVDRALTLEDLRGKVVLLDFLTYGCINCLHVIPDLHELEARHPSELVVIGVHSAKFDHEGGTDAIRRFAERYGVEHPMVNDHRFEIWNSYGIRAWPSSVLIDPEGHVVGRHVGEGVLAALGEPIAAVIDEHDRRGTLDRSPLPALASGAVVAPSAPLRFPGGIAIEPEAGLLAISDSSVHRVVVVRLDGAWRGSDGASASSDAVGDGDAPDAPDAPPAEVIAVFGDGRPDLRDGTASEARFHRPHGLTFDGPDRLYVADTGNHALRRINLRTATVETLAGTGEQVYLRRDRWDGRSGGRSNGPSGLNSPWDVEVVGNVAYLAMAGQHQIWQVDLDTGRLTLHAGSGREILHDGPLREAALNQPSGLALLDDRLIVADAEASAVRSADLHAAGSLRTLVGVGLFDFGDVDGVGDAVRLQHPKALAVDVAPHPAEAGADAGSSGSLVYLTDTYNHKVKALNPVTREVRTVLGDGVAGWRDGTDARLHEPGALAVANGVAWIADTNNHAVRAADLASGEVATLVLRDPDGLLTSAEDDDGFFAGTTVRTEARRVAPGDGRLELNVTLPSSYVRNDLAPLRLHWRVEGDAVRVAPEDLRREVVEPDFPLRLSVPATFSEGVADVTAELTTYYCRKGAEALCLVDQVRIASEVSVTGDDRGGDASSVVWTHRPPPVIDRR
ncbi:MAG: thioredoxin-like domain-containing protein [Trueperaceae bacterium]